jgi:hypothetical protein
MTRSGTLSKPIPNLPHKLSLKLYKDLIPLFHGLAVSTHIGIVGFRTRRDAKQSNPPSREIKLIVSRTRAEQGMTNG